jgi:hypothetical protein
VFIGKREISGLGEKKMGSKEKGDLQKKIWPHPFNHVFFGNEVPYLKGDFHQMEFEENWCRL